MPVLVHGTLASRERAPRRGLARGQLMGSCCFVRGGGAGGRRHAPFWFVCAGVSLRRGQRPCGALRRPVAQRWRLVAAIASCASAKAACRQPDARSDGLSSEAQDKAKSTELMQKRARVAARLRARALELCLLCSSVFQAAIRAGFSTIARAGRRDGWSPPAGGNKSPQKSPKTAPRARENELKHPIRQQSPFADRPNAGEATIMFRPSWLGPCFFCAKATVASNSALWRATASFCSAFCCAMTSFLFKGRTLSIVAARDVSPTEGHVPPVGRGGRRRR